MILWLWFHLDPLSCRCQRWSTHPGGSRACSCLQMCAAVQPHIWFLLKRLYVSSVSLLPQTKHLNVHARVGGEKKAKLQPRMSRCWMSNSSSSVFPASCSWSGNRRLHITSPPSRPSVRSPDQRRLQRQRQETDNKKKTATRLSVKYRKVLVFIPS